MNTLAVAKVGSTVRIDTSACAFTAYHQANVHRPTQVQHEAVKFVVMKHQVHCTRFLNGMNCPFDYYIKQRC
jgi:hypothetical protein